MVLTVLVKMKLAKLLSQLLHKPHACISKSSYYAFVRAGATQVIIIDHALPQHSASMIGVTDHSIPALEEHFIYVS